MSALFPRWTNTFARVAAVSAVGVPVVALSAVMLLQRTPYVTNQHVELVQPIQFDHRHHNWEEGIDCRFCHAQVETSATAGIPATSLCMGCHAQVFNKSPRLEPLRQAYFSKTPVAWKRVHDLPDFVYFNHSIHVRKGVGCVTCHGRVDRMPMVYQAEPLTMQWCVDCHRAPQQHLRPLDAVTDMQWQAPVSAAQRAELGQRLAQANDVHPRTACDTCPR